MLHQTIHGVSLSHHHCFSFKHMHMELYINHEQGRMMIDKTEVWYKGREKFAFVITHVLSCLWMCYISVYGVREKGQSDIIQQPLVLHKIKP